VVDLGIRFDSNLTFRTISHKKISKAYSVLGTIKRNFVYMNEHIFILLSKSMIRPHVESADLVWFLQN